MGLDAFVSCRCWQDGRTPPPPVGPVGFDEDGYLAWLGAGDGWTEADAAFCRWRDSACPHDQMEQCGEYVANWTGYRLFQQALEAAGWSDYPTLRDELPSANGGRMPPEAAARVLDELALFERQATIDDGVELVDEATGEVLLEYVAAYQGVLMTGPGYRAGVDPRGFFVLDDRCDPPVELFRSARFRQRVYGEQVQFDDEAGSARVTMGAIGTAVPPPHRLRVRTTRRSPADFDDIVGPLRRLCRAAVTTGNPVVWC